MDNDSVISRIRKEIEEKRKKQNIICPYCSHVQDNETRCSFVTYWGEDEAKECSCEYCNKNFIVKEVVERTFECSKIADYIKEKE